MNKKGYNLGRIVLWSVVLGALVMPVMGLCEWNVPFVPVSEGDALGSLPDAQKAASSVMVVLRAASLALCTGLFVISGAKVNSGDFLSALLSFIGGVIAGLSPDLAQRLL